MAQKANKIEVKTTVEGKEVSTGVLFNHGNSVSFKYNASFVGLPKSFDLFPALPRTSFAPFHFNGLGVFSDCAPDRWGRTLIQRALKRNRVSEVEYLLNVDDAARQGALRFYIKGEAQAPKSNIPLVISLPELLSIADKIVLQSEITDVEAKKLFDATGSLGGARPKACVRDANKLYVAKFPKPVGDAWDVIGWEFVTLKLAEAFEIEVPEAKKIDITDKQARKRSTMLTKRFDREGLERIHYMSAMTALQQTDGAGGDWQDLAELTAEFGASTHQLFKRAIFGCAIGNLDNHLRNHGFLLKNNAWQLSPAFDMNPQPHDAGKDIYQLALFGENELNIKAFLTKSALELFNVSKTEAKGELKQLCAVLKKAINIAKRNKLDLRSVELLAPRFEHSANEIEGLLA